MPAQNEALKALIAKAAAKASEDEFHAAKSLQTAWRGKAARVTLRTRSNAATTLAAVWRDAHVRRSNTPDFLASADEGVPAWLQTAATALRLEPVHVDAHRRSVPQGAGAPTACTVVATDVVSGLVSSVTGAGAHEHASCALPSEHASITCTRTRGTSDTPSEPVCKSCSQEADEPQLGTTVFDRPDSAADATQSVDNELALLRAAVAKEVADVKEDARLARLEAAMVRAALEERECSALRVQQRAQQRAEEQRMAERRAQPRVGGAGAEAATSEGGEEAQNVDIELQLLSITELAGEVGARMGAVACLLEDALKVARQSTVETIEWAQDGWRSAGMHDRVPMWLQPALPSPPAAPVLGHGGPCIGPSDQPLTMNDF